MPSINDFNLHNIFIPPGILSGTLLICVELGGAIHTVPVVRKPGLSGSVPRMPITQEMKEVL